MTNILIGATGSIAAIKVPLLVDFFQKHAHINVKVVVTESAHFFIKDMEIHCPVYREQDEWNEWKKISDPILHIELRNWADIMVIAPLDANTLGKLANGLCDNLLTCVLRAWDVSKPVVACPAMNTSMWHHPFTVKHLEVLENVLDYKIIQPISKKLACGDTGVGAMAESHKTTMPTKKSMKAVFDCSADEPGELSFKEGDILVDVQESGEEGWYTGRIQHTSETGLFPYNYVVELSPAQEKEERPLSKFPPLDAFEAAMSPSAGKASLKSNNNNWTSTATATTISPPPTIAAKPKLASTAPSSSSSSNMGSGIRVYGSSSSSKPQLKPIGSIKYTESSISPTRSRSYSTSAVLNTSEKEPMQTEKTLRPSQLLSGKGTKSALELALSKGSPKLPSSTSVKSNAFSASMGSSTGGIALPGMSTTKLNNTPHDAVEEEEDGFQMVKPSQLRSRQQQQVIPIRPIISQSSSFTSATSTRTITPSWKKAPDTRVYTNVRTASPSSLSSATPSPKPASGSKLDAAPSTSTPMPRLPSRPVSTASRRSRNSRHSASSLKSSPSTSSNTTSTVSNAALPPVRETNEKSSSAPPVLKPKPQIAATANATAQPNLPPRPKLRSTSNPPPIQPKPAMSSIEILLSKNNKNESTVSTTPSKSTTPPPRNAATKPALPSTNKKPMNVSSGPSLDSWQSLDAVKESSQDMNIKPSALLKNNRARSATNPVSSSTTPEWMSALNRQSKPAATTTTTTTKPAPVPYERPASPIAHPVSRSPAPMAAAVIEPATTTTTKKNPPPPPPSRPPKSQNSNSKQRYEALFDTIHDGGYVDGETAHFVWLKSRLSNEDLARIWRQCDPDHKGLLDKHAFIDGMSKIDELLSLKQQQQAV
ncbi:phosphopantothenoylcysteine decarboxylase [Mucor ambiguus]|uniref:Phosphopantothenoylcysteine decarboxylase n=1 Tax=Mucor ambiguus TaxID=91626 RepID=A0A0C9MH80_9FUNG|nr:phosphopantothenoylcysteine decarboxylase [Mucor ambiguus]